MGGAMAKGHGRSKTDCCCIDKIVNVENKSAELFRRHHFSGIGRKWSETWVHVDIVVNVARGPGGGRGFQRHDDIDVAVIDIDVDMSMDVAG